jgi:transcriptional regulator with PAS, ATPase and Fis domain
MRIAKHDAGVLITGESGVGKEYAAQYLHRCGNSGRERPFIAVNCAAMPENLLEAEMFGYERGAFTGAERRHRGVFERAHCGTLFLDEIGEMSVAMQAKLLRAIQEGIVQRIGSEETIRVDVRLVCATNRDLRKMVREGGFREDLFYRINVIHVPIPPLRERKEDILWFARRFIADSARKHSLSRYLTPLAERYLEERSWPGNLRELRHAIERACILARQEMIGPKELGSTDVDEAGSYSSDGRDLKSCLQDYEDNLIREALEAHRWHIAETADSLKISRKNLWEKMRKYRIDKKKSDGI